MECVLGCVMGLDSRCVFTNRGFLDTGRVRIGDRGDRESYIG